MRFFSLRLNTIGDLLKLANIENAKSCPTLMCTGGKLSKTNGTLFDHLVGYRNIVGRF